MVLYENVLKNLTKLLDDENLFAEILRDLVKDEIKSYIKSKLDTEVELKNEYKKALQEYFACKLMETYALIKFTKCMSELGIKMLPVEIKQKMFTLIDKEIDKILEIVK